MPPPAHHPAKVPLYTKRPGPIRAMLTARKNVLELIPQAAVHDPIVSGKIGPTRWHMVMEPTALKRVFHENVQNYPKSNSSKNMLKSAVGQSMFVTEGAQWRQQRRTAAPVFSSRNVQNLAPVMQESAKRTVARLGAMDGQIIDLYQEMIVTTFEIIADVTLSGDDRFDRAKVHRAVDAYVHRALRVSFLDVLDVPAWVPRPARLLSRSLLEGPRRLADQIITHRRKFGPLELPDLLDLMLASEDPKTKRKFNTAELRDNLLTFIIAGHKTTALSLAWALYLCAFDPTAQARARTEAQTALNGRIATAADLPHLPFTRAIIEESLRLYPPVAFLSRTAQADDMLCGRKIRPKDTIMLPIYALHRHHALWENPDAFHPDRFIGAAPPPYAFLPFGNGPRVCIGAQFAMQEAVILLSTLLARFEFTALPDHTPVPEMVFTLRPKGGVVLRVNKVT